MHCGRIPLYAKRYDEAEIILREVIEDWRKPTLTAYLRHLSDKCRNLQGRAMETADLLKMLTHGITSLFGGGHPWIRY